MNDLSCLFVSVCVCVCVCVCLLACDDYDGTLVFLPSLSLQGNISVPGSVGGSVNHICAGGHLPWVQTPSLPCLLHLYIVIGCCYRIAQWHIYYGFTHTDHIGDKVNLFQISCGEV